MRWLNLFVSSQRCISLRWKVFGEEVWLRVLMWVNGSLSRKRTCFWESLDIPEKSEKTIAGTNSVHHTCVNRAREWVYVQFYSLWISNTHFHSIKQNIFFPITDFLWTQTFVQLAFSLYIGQGRAFWMFYYINAPLGPYEEQLTEPSGPFCNK